MELNRISSITDFRKKIIIDCGHITIFSKKDLYTYGLLGNPSVDELKTLELGIKLLHSLKKDGKEPYLSICLSDLVGIKNGNQERNKILEDILKGKKREYLPIEYLSMLDSNGIGMDEIVISLQSKCNEKFKKIIRRVRSSILQSADIPNYSESFFDEYNALFLTSIDNDLFSLSTPFLTNTDKEDQHFKGNIWREREYKIKEGLLVNLPLLRLKKNPIINLYESGGKVLCPATYGGLLCHFDNSFDHIAIASRNDDEFIGEKLNRGAIATNILVKDFSRTCVQIIISKAGKYEISIIKQGEIEKSRKSYDEFTQELQTKLAQSDMVVM